MKTPLTILVSVIMLLSTGLSEEGRWVIGGESNLTIHGTSNINSFTCKVSFYSIEDTLVYSKDIKTKDLCFSDHQMIIPIANFDCGHKQITKDFGETLNAKRYPEMTINFISFQDFTSSKESRTTGTLDITLAGVTRQYTVYYSIQMRNTKSFLLKGSQRVTFADFGLETPKKMMGLIQVQEDLDVNFNLALRPL